MGFEWRKKEVLNEIKEEFERTRAKDKSMSNMKLPLYNGDYIFIKDTGWYMGIIVQLVQDLNEEIEKGYSDNEPHSGTFRKMGLPKFDLDKLLTLTSEFIDYSFFLEERRNKLFYGNWRR